MSSGAAATLAICGSWQAARVFVPGPLGPGAVAGRAAFRGSSVTGAPGVAQGSSEQQRLGLAAVTGVLTLGTAVQLTGRRSRTARKAEAAATPPPPPPFDPAAQLGVTAPLGFFDPLNFAPPGGGGHLSRGN